MRSIWRWGKKAENLHNAAAFCLFTPQSPTATAVSLRLGHGAALTIPRMVIHSRAAAALPKIGEPRL